MVAAPPSESESEAGRQTGPRLRCWRCKKANLPAFLCSHCDAVQSLPSDSNYSTLLGFDGYPDIDEQSLQTRYYELSRQLHPDRFQTGTTEEQRASLQATALLNAAFTTLRDVESRGRWWLDRCGEPLGRDNNQVPAGLAEQVFEIQEKIAELAGAAGSDRTGLLGELRQIQTDLTKRVNEERATVDNLLRDWPRDPEPPETRAELKRVLSELSYLRTLTRNVRAALEG